MFTLIFESIVSATTTAKNTLAPLRLKVAKVLP